MQSIVGRRMHDSVLHQRHDRMHFVPAAKQHARHENQDRDRRAFPRLQEYSRCREGHDAARVAEARYRNDAGRDDGSKLCRRAEYAESDWRKDEGKAGHSANPQAQCEYSRPTGNPEHHDAGLARMSGPDPLTVALDAAREAGEVLLTARHQPLEIREKGRRADLVTNADRAAEDCIRRHVLEKFPQAAFLAEEGGALAGSSGERWIVDPLDGTTNYAHDYPLFCVSIAYERDGELLAGVVYAPVMAECFAAERGAGATRNGERIRVSSIARLADALTCTGFHPADFERNALQFGAVSQRAQAVRRDGSAALDLAYVACGRFDGFWEFDLSPWDVAAGTLLIHEAGGRVSQCDGARADVSARSILATNGCIHDELKAALAPGPHDGAAGAGGGRPSNA